MSCRMATRTGWKPRKNLLSFWQTFVNSFKEKSHASEVHGNVLLATFASMNVLAVFFEAKSRSTANYKRANMSSVRCSESNETKVTFCTTIVCNGTKLPLVFIFKGQSNRKLEKTLQDVLPEGTFGLCQSEG